MKGVALSFDERDVIINSLYSIERELMMLFFSQKPINKEQQARISEQIHKCDKILSL